MTNQHIGFQPLKIGRDASILKLSQNGGTETIQQGRVKPIEVIKGPFTLGSVEFSLLNT